MSSRMALGWNPAEVPRLNRTAWRAASVPSDEAHVMNLPNATNGLTCGYELEQPSEYVERDIDIHSFEQFIRRSHRETHYDASGPLEWTYGPFTFGNHLVRWFQKDIEAYARRHPSAAAGRPYYFWDYVNEYRSGASWSGCGCHWHIAPDMRFFRGHPTYPPGQAGETEAVTILWNTGGSIMPFLMPFMAFGAHFRRKAFQWAVLPTSCRHSVDTVRALIDSRGYRRVYSFLTWNPPRDVKPLTVEFRAPSTHPYVAAVGLKMFGYIMMKVYEKTWTSQLASPKLTHESWLKVVSMVNRILNQGGESSASSARSPNLFSLMDSTDYGPIIFETGRALPGRLPHKLRWRTPFELTRALIRQQLVWQHHDYTNWYTRILWLIYNKGDISGELTSTGPRGSAMQTVWTTPYEDFPGWRTVPPFPQAGFESQQQLVEDAYREEGENLQHLEVR